jgi:glucose-6-phosphate isomerase, archaeal
MTPELEFLGLRLDLESGCIEGAPLVRRHLSDLRGLFVDRPAYDRQLAAADPLLYSVSSVEAGQDEGELHYGLGILMPGKVGNEYYFTKGHLHAWRPAAEVYLGLRGEGLMLLERDHESRAVALGPQRVVYVPGYTAHRTVNTGSEPLVYVGIYPARAGHDYKPIAERNFRQVVMEQDGRSAVLDRSTLRA